MAINNPVSNEHVVSTKKSAIGLVIAGILCVVVVALAVWYVVSNPDVMKDIGRLILVIIAAIVLIAIIIVVAMFVLAIPFYAIRGERFQKDVSYDMDDVKSVESKNDKNGGAH